MGRPFIYAISAGGGRQFCDALSRQITGHRYLSSRLPPLSCHPSQGGAEAPGTCGWTKSRPSLGSRCKRRSLRPMPEDDTPPPSPPPSSRPTGSQYGVELPLPEELQAVLGGGYVVQSFLGQG